LFSTQSNIENFVLLDIRSDAMMLDT